MLINGKDLAEKKQEHLAQLLRETQEKPNLSVILVDHNHPPSQLYVARKQKACETVGIGFELDLLPRDVSQEAFEKKIENLNQNPHIHGILVQLPLPKHLVTQSILQKIDPKKDVDGLTLINQGALALGLDWAMVPCTPLGVMELLNHEQVPILGQRAAVIGRSALVGWPLVKLLNQKGATVTCIHSQTKNPQLLTQEADILVVAAGVPHLVTKDWVKKGSVVIDVGIHKTKTGSLQGDVCFDEVKEKVRLITPVPGGVGPMTIACLLDNCLKAYRKF